MQANDQPATAPEIARAHFQICTPRVAHQTIDGETVIIDFETGAYYSTTRLGAEIWDHLAAGSTVDDILQATALRYAGDLPAMAAAIREFLGLLERETLIAPAHFDSELLPAAPAGPLPAERVPFEPPALHKFTDMADLLLLDPIHDVDESGWPTKKA